MIASIRVAAIDAFEVWLRARGDASDVARFNRSIVEGFVAFTSDGKVEPEHVEQGVRFAREAGIPEMDAVERIGALLVAFTRGEAPPAAPTPTLTPKRLATEPPANELPAVEPSPTAEQAAPRERAVSRKLASGLLVGAAVILGMIVVSRFEGDPETAASKAPDAPTNAPVTPPEPRAGLTRLDGVGLAGRLPAGWRVESAEQPGAAILYRGRDSADPDHGAYLATVPATRTSDDALLAAARTAEREIGIRFDATNNEYLSHDCTVDVLPGSRAAHCKGSVGAGTVELYVRALGDQHVVALFIAKSSVAPATAASDARTITASLTR